MNPNALNLAYLVGVPAAVSGLLALFPRLRTIRASAGLCFVAANTIAAAIIGQAPDVRNFTLQVGFFGLLPCAALFAATLIPIASRHPALLLLFGPIAYGAGYVIASSVWIYVVGIY